MEEVFCLKGLKAAPNFGEDVISEVEFLRKRRQINEHDVFVSNLLPKLEHLVASMIWFEVHYHNVGIFSVMLLPLSYDFVEEVPELCSSVI